MKKIRRLKKENVRIHRQIKKKQRDVRNRYHWKKERQHWAQWIKIYHWR